jgi:type IV pilus assembly protein PilO
VAIQLRDPKTQKLILAGILGAAVLYVYFLTALVPFTYKATAADLKDLTGRYQQLNRDLTAARQTVNSLPYLEREYALLHDRWLQAQRLLPAEEETAAMLRAMTLVGDQSGVDFLLFRPLPAQAAQYYTEYPIEVKVEGGYHEVGAFLGELANMERIVTVSDLTIEAPKDADTENPAVAAFIAKTYTEGGTGVPPEAAVDEEKGNVKKTAQQAAKIGRKLKAKTRGESSDE